jgi:hypothetical protein
MPNSLWEKLPEDIQSSVAAMQHAGAAINTAFERIEKLKEELGDQINDNDNNTDDTPRTPSLTSLPLLSYAASSGAASPNEAPEMPSTPISHLDLSQIEEKTAVLQWPTSPILLGMMSRRNSLVSVITPPTHPRVAQWRAETSHLREECLVRLRHAFRKVDLEWHALLHDYNTGREAPSNWDEWTATSLDFESWMQAKKAVLKAMEEKSKALGHVVLGWGVA